MNQIKIFFVKLLIYAMKNGPGPLKMGVPSYGDLKKDDDEAWEAMDLGAAYF